LTDEKQALLAKVTKSKFQLRAQLDASQKRLAAIDAEMEKNKTEGRVRVRNICHPGVSINIRGVRYLVKEKLRFTRFVYEDGVEIKGLKCEASQPVCATVCLTNNILIGSNLVLNILRRNTSNDT